MRTVISHRELADGDVRAHWLAEVEIAGEVFRVADEDVEVVDANGLTWLYVSGLEDLEHTIEYAGVKATSLTIGSDVAAEVDGWPELLGRMTIPRPPWGGKARLLRWVEGQTLDEARVFVEGVVRGGRHGASLDALTVEIEGVVATKTLVPPDAAQISPRTWPSSASYQVDERMNGAVYPLIIGKPGGSATWGLATLYAHASPAYLADYAGAAHLYGNSKIILGWVPDGTTLVDTTVSVMDASGGSAAPGGLDGAWTIDASMTVQYTTDLLGRKVAYVSPDAWLGWGQTILFRPDGEYYIKYTNGGVYNQERSGVLRRAGEVIEMLLGWGGVPVATGRMEAARIRLDRYLLDFPLVDSTDMEQFVAREIGAVIPLCRRSNSDGVWFELLRYDATPEDVVMHLIVPERDIEASGYAELDEDIAATTAWVERASDDVTWEPDWDQVVNEFDVEYAPTRGDELTRRVVVTGDPEPDFALTSAFAMVCGSSVCAASRSRYGVREGKPIDLPIVHDDATAVLVALELALRCAIPRRVVELRGNIADLEPLEPGDVIRLTDRERGFHGALALVRSMTLGLDMAEIEVEALDHLTLTSPVGPDELSIDAAFPGAAVILDAYRVTAAAGVISQITDHTANGANATTVSGTAPTWSSSYAPFQGRPAIVCSGGSIDTTATFAQDDLTLVVAMYDPGVTGSWESPVGANYNNNISWFRDNASDPNEWTIGVIEGGAPYGQVVTAADGAPHVFVLRRSGAQHSVWVDGTKAAEKTGTTTTTTAATLKLGTAPAGGNFGGALAFVGLWSRSLTDDEIDALSNRLWRGHLGQTGEL